MDVIDEDSDEVTDRQRQTQNEDKYQAPIKLYQLLSRNGALPFFFFSFFGASDHTKELIFTSKTINIQCVLWIRTQKVTKNWRMSCEIQSLASI